MAFLALATVSCLSSAREIEHIQSPSKEITIIQDCDKSYVCSYTYKKKGDSKTYPIATDIKGSNVAWVGDIAYVTVSFGSYDSTTLFIDGDHEVFSVSDLVAVDKKGECFVSIEKNNLVFNNLFSKRAPIKSISSKDKSFNFQRAPTLQAVIEGEFTPQGDFKLSYTDQSEKEQTRLIKSPCNR